MSDAPQATHGPPKPGPEHHRLEPFVGRFRARVTIFAGPGQSFESTGTMVNSWQLDGLYLQQDYVGDKPDGPFPSFAGKGFWGFNTTTRQYEGFWIDNASTTMQVETGNVDADGKVWIMHSRLVHPGTRSEQARRSVITITDQDQHRMDSFATGGDGREHKTMEIEYRRA